MCIIKIKNRKLESDEISFTLLFNLLLIFVSIVSVLNVSAGGPTCKNAYSCANFDNVTSIDSEIRCYGAFSCTNVSLIETSSDSLGVVCGGAYSCYKSLTIRNSNYGTRIECLGLYSCSDVNYIYGTGPIYCNGENACINSNIYKYNHNLFCWGFRSCKNAYIQSSHNLQFLGAYSGENGIFSSISGSNTQFVFFGHYSATNATVICNSGHTCSIDCRGNACNLLNNNSIICNNCNSLTISCTYAEFSEVCPNGYNINNSLILGNLITNNMYNLPSIKNIKFSTIENSYNLCFNNNGIINGDDFKQYNTSSELINNNTICCTGKYSCFELRDFIISGINNINDVSLRCDGHFSCLNNQNADEITTINGGSFYFTGQATVRKYFDISSQNMNNTNVYCTANYACFHTDILNVNNIYGVARYAGYYSYVDNIAGNVYYYSHEAGM